MKVSLISTVLNEANNLHVFLESLKKQSKLPDEVVICDAGSTDGTVKILQDFAKIFPRPVKLIVKQGNRSHGRNVAIYHAQHEIIAGTDAGCLLDHRWLEHLMAPFDEDPSVDVVSGFYEARGETDFEKCAALVTLSTRGIKPDTFLPSARSIAFKKSAWQAVGGFPEHLEFAEDTFFALALRNSGKYFVFAGEALVYWRPRTSTREIYSQARSYARGNREAGILYMNYIRLHLRYGIWFGLIFGMFYSVWLFILLCIACIPYWISWSIAGWKSTHRWKSILFTPWIKLIYDAGTFTGFWNSARICDKI
jgi:glycosyltransferase involved in cell wall biosynthesis